MVEIGVEVPGDVYLVGIREELDFSVGANLRSISTHVGRHLINSQTDEAAENLISGLDRYSSTTVVDRRRCRCLPMNAKITAESNSLHRIAKDFVVSFFGICFRQAIDLRKMPLAFIGQIVVE